MPGIILLMVVSGATVVRGCLSGIPDYRNDWTLQWQEDFDTLNASRWNVRNNESHCCPNELELYLERNVQVGNGMLQILTKNESAVGPVPNTNETAVYNYTSGWVDTKLKQNFTFGAYEFRAKLPSNNANGIWPALWFLPASDDCWPTGGEIDVMEMIGNPFFPYLIAGSLRYGSSCGHNQQVLPGALFSLDGSASDEYHLFQVVWNASALFFGIDDCFYEAVINSDNADSENNIVPVGNMYMIIDTAVAPFFPPGPHSPGYPTAHYIDYIRWYSPPPPPLLRPVVSSE